MTNWKSKIVKERTNFWLHCVLKEEIKINTPWQNSKGTKWEWIKSILPGFKKHWGQKPKYSQTLKLSLTVGTLKPSQGEDSSHKKAEELGTPGVCKAIKDWFCCSGPSLRQIPHSQSPVQTLTFRALAKSSLWHLQASFGGRTATSFSCSIIFSSHSSWGWGNTTKQSLGESSVN